MASQLSCLQERPLYAREEPSEVDVAASASLTRQRAPLLIRSCVCFSSILPPSSPRSLFRAILPRNTRRTRTSERSTLPVPVRGEERSPEAGALFLLESGGSGCVYAIQRSTATNGGVLLYLRSTSRRVVAVPLGFCETGAQPPRCRLKIIAETFASHVIGKFDSVSVASSAGPKSELFVIHDLTKLASAVISRCSFLIFIPESDVSCVP